MRRNSGTHSCAKKDLTRAGLARHASERRRHRPSGARFAALHSADFCWRARRRWTRTPLSASSTSSASGRSGDCRVGHRRQRILLHSVAVGRTIVYKGLLLAPQIENFYGELSDPDVTSALCLVHQRFSTNTFPSWQAGASVSLYRAQRRDQHAEGQRNWMHARQSILKSPLFRRRHEEAVSDHRAGGSDSASFDNAVELLFQAGRSIPHVMAMLIPEAWAGNPHMKPEKRAFYEYHASLMEPWDGPAAIAFTDGRMIGATLDRNGLRPGRYVVTHDDLVVMASEAGVLSTAAGKNQAKRPLAAGKDVPGRHGRRPHHRRQRDQEAAGGAQPYGEWLKENQITLDQLPEPVARACVRSRHDSRAAAGVRLHRRRFEDDDGADGHQGRGAGRLHGNGYAAGLPVATSRSRCSTTSSSSSRR